jgi:1-acylglycerone phosphate reductase
MKRTILVTGCSDGGLGAALALELNRTGWRVFATARNPAKMTQMDAAGIEKLTLDVQSPESLAACVAEVSKMTDGSLDGLINNAGGGLSMPVMDLDIAEARQMFDLNVWSPVATAQAFLPLLLKAQNGAILANHTSVAGQFGLPFQGAYNASKAALSLISEAQRLELQPFGIKVVDIQTAVVKSNFFGNIAANEYTTKLPENSIYQIAREPVEQVLSGFFGGKHVTETGQDAGSWAKQVVRDLNKKNPPMAIMRGTNSWSVWLVVNFIPHGWLDFMAKQMTNLDKVEAAVKKQKHAKM